MYNNTIDITLSNSELSKVSDNEYNTTSKVIFNGKEVDVYLPSNTKGITRQDNWMPKLFISTILIGFNLFLGYQAINTIQVKAETAGAISSGVIEYR